MLEGLAQPILVLKSVSVAMVWRDSGQVARDEIFVFLLLLSLAFSLGTLFVAHVFAMGGEDSLELVGLFE